MSRALVLAGAAALMLAACKGPAPTPAATPPAPAQAALQTAPALGMPGATWTLRETDLTLATDQVNLVMMACKGERLLVNFVAVEPVDGDRDLKFGPAGSLLATIPVPEIPPPGMTVSVPLPTPIFDRFADWPAMDVAYRQKTVTYPLPPGPMRQAFVDRCNAGAAAARAG